MNEQELNTVAQLRAFLTGTQEVHFEPIGNQSKRHTAPEKDFTRKFTVADVALLAQTDALHGTLSGPATKCLMQRAVAVFGDARNERLADISVVHLYNLRRRSGYETKRRQQREGRLSYQCG